MRTKWTNEMLREEALKYNTRIEFQKGSSAYQAAQKRGILDEICSHIKPKLIKWCYKMIKEDALKYDSRNDYSKYGLSYHAAHKRGILDDVCYHMNGNIQWTYDMLKNEALKYNTKKEFYNTNYNAYSTAQRRDILDDICSHMKGNIQWTYDMLKNEALKYNTIGLFRDKNYKAYVCAKRRGILSDICSHMSKLGNSHNRFIYTIKFEDDDNSIYIGLTSNLERRKLQHIKCSSNKYVNKLIKSNVKYIFHSDNILYISTCAAEIECNLIEEYREKGYNILNISKGGGLGSIYNKWSYERLKEEALKYNYRSSFKKDSLAYSIAQQRGILDEICKHMTAKYNKWSYEKLKEEALKYDNKFIFIRCNRKAYKAAYKKGILNDICKHMLK